MSASNASSSSQLVSYAQDIDYTHMEGFKQFKVRYNVKNAQAARNDPNGVYPSAKMVYQAVKGPGCTLHSLNALSLDNFISTGSVATCCCIKRLSLAPYYTAQMKQCMQKWDRCDDQGPNLGTIDTCHQLIGIVGTGIYHLMADVQYTVGQTVDLVLASTGQPSFLVQQCNALCKQCGDHADRATWSDQGPGGRAPIF